MIKSTSKERITPLEIKITKAKICDVPAIQRLINHFAKDDQMLARSLSEIYENLRDYFVCKNDSKLIGCAALHIDWADLAEIKSLAVKPETQKKGIGKSLVKKCVAEAKELGIRKVFTLTYQPNFFKKLGFKEMDKKNLPHKIWSECLKCPKFPDCDETALYLNLKMKKGK